MNPNTCPPPQETAMRRPQHLTLVAALLCCGLSLPGWAQQAPGVSAQAATVPSRTSVGVARLDTVWIQPEREAPASVIARNESKLSAEVSGTLLRWTADVGAQVARGQVLAQIDPRDAELAVQRAQAALDASQARLKLAQAQLQRSRDLVAQGFFSQEALAQRETEVTLVQTELSTSRAQLATAQRQLAKTTLRAPFGGSVKERLAQTGESVAPGSVLYVLSESGAAELQAILSPADVPGLRAGSELRFDAAGEQLPVRLLRVGSTLSAPARTQTARLAFAPAASSSTPPAGTSGTLRWRESRPHLPPALMVRRNGALGVFVQQGSGAQATARFVAIPGAQEGRASALPAALGAETVVVVNGQAALQQGAAIDARPAAGRATN
jgi:RND family efflux transporter MFP subunit